MSDPSSTDPLTATPQDADAPETVPGPALTRTLEGLYRELLEGMPTGEPTWVTTGGPEGGLYSAVADLDAEQASRELDGTTVAAHAEHVRWALQLVNDYFEGVEPTSNWSESWKVSTVDEREWAELQAALRDAGARLLENLATRQRWNEGMSMQGALASYGHTAYHVGAVRQLRKRLLAG